MVTRFTSRGNLEALGDANMLGDGCEAQDALASWPDCAACFENIGLAPSARVEKRQLHRDDLARRRLNRGDYPRIRVATARPLTDRTWILQPNRETPIRTAFVRLVCGNSRSGTARWRRPGRFGKRE
jgi:hypothetical protein